MKTPHGERKPALIHYSRDPRVAVKNDYLFRIPDPDLPIHYTTSIALRRRLKFVYSRAVQKLKPFSGEKNLSRRNGPKISVLGKMGVETVDFGFATPKR